LIWSGEQLVGSSVKFSGFWHPAVSLQHIALVLSSALCGIGRAVSIGTRIIQPFAPAVADELPAHLCHPAHRIVSPV